MTRGILYRMFISGFIFYAGIVSGQSIEKYELNDPRNPDCPCHKYQKSAEEEYKQLLAKKENNAGIAHASVTEKNTGRSVGGIGQDKEESAASIKNNSSAGSTNSQGKKHTSRTKRKHKKKGKSFYRWRKIADVKHWNLWKELTDPSSCYHWN